MKRKSIPVLLFIIMGISSYGQSLEDIYAARDDSQVYMQHYLTPVMNGLMYGLNNTWYHRANIHELWEVSVEVSLTAAMVPEEDKNFIFNNGEYNYLSMNGTNPMLPTIAGGETNAELTLSYQGTTTQLQAPDGLAEEWPVQIPLPVSFPTPMAQVGIGAPLGTDVIIRFSPNLENNGWKFGLFGLGVKHSISQYFDQEKKNKDKSKEQDESTWDLAALAAFTRMKVTYIPEDTGVTGTEQQMNLDVNAYTFQLIAGVDYGIVNLFASLGYVAGVSGLMVEGTYEFDLDNNGNISQDERVTDPVDIQFEMSGVNLTAGASLNLGPVSVFSSYTIQKYPALMAGVAVSIN